jgi:hypothetical protein
MFSTISPVLWTAFMAFVLLALAVDLGVFHLVDDVWVINFVARANLRVINSFRNWEISSNRRSQV